MTDHHEKAADSIIEQIRSKGGCPIHKPMELMDHLATGMAEKFEDENLYARIMYIYLTEIAEEVCQGNTDKFSIGRNAICNTFKKCNDDLNIGIIVADAFPHDAPETIQ